MLSCRSCIVALVAVVNFAALPLAAQPGKVANIAGTQWSGPDSNGSFYTYYFERNGRLTYRSPSGTYRNGTWAQNCDMVYFEMNDGYCEHIGDIRGNTMRGLAGNVTGAMWLWDATKD
ncbi:MAG: hypothetical protein ACJ8C4_08295 [Gemmataceae bacterium]